MLHGPIALIKVNQRRSLHKPFDSQVRQGQLVYCLGERLPHYIARSLHQLEECSRIFGM
jgi:hypothetical protein